MNKYVIGLGCSWTQGEGGYPEEVWKSHNGRVNVRRRPDVYLREYEHQNSWVKVLTDKYLPDHTPVNLGVRGIGNRAAVKQLMFCDTVDFANSSGYVVLMLSGFERFDFFQRTPLGPNHDDHYDGYSSTGYRHYKWRTMWPCPDNGDQEEPLWRFYAKEMFSEEFIASEAMMALIEVQNFCKLYGFKLIVANAFNQQHEGVHKYMTDTTKSLAAKFDWSQYVHDRTDYVAMIQKLVQLDGVIPMKDWGSYHNKYLGMDWPQKYLTNCIHPTVEGYKVIADEIATFINSR